MDNLDVICIGAAIVDIPLQPVSKNIFDVDSYPLERIAMTNGGDAINEATIISRLGHRTALMSRIGKDAAGQFILDHCRKENIDIQSLKQDVSIDTSINVGLVTEVAGITAIDTIGAGDNFASGFIAALLEGKNLRECARFANATAAISVLSIGATTGVKNRKLVEQLLEEYEG